MNRTKWAVISAVAAIVVASSLPGQAQTTTAQTAATQTATAAADACLTRPGAAGPKGTHWYYRIERPSGRKCWYLGSADQKQRRAERRATPVPTPRPVEEEPAQAAADARVPATPETTAQDMAARETAAPAQEATTYNAGAAARMATTTNTHDATAGWPGIPDTGDASHRDAPAVNGNDAETAAMAQTEAPAEQADMPLVWPPLAPEQANAARSFESTASVASLVVFLAAAGAFVAVAFRAVLQLWSGWFAGRVRSRPVVARAEPIIRSRAPGAPPPRERSVPARERFASEQSIEAMTEPTIARLREIAARWETPRHIPRAPRVAPLDETQDAEHDAPPPPWRRRAMAQ
jgi:hypothetical protein